MLTPWFHCPPRCSRTLTAGGPGGREPCGVRSIARATVTGRSPGRGASPSVQVVGAHHLSRAQARRIAVQAQLLDDRRPADLLDLVRHLTLLQIDPTAAVAPSADLVAWSRLGSSYRPAQLTSALEQDRTLFEHNAMVRPTDD